MLKCPAETLRIQKGEEQQCSLEYLEVVDYSDVSGRCFPDGVIYNSISLRTRDATGGQDLVILIHTQRLPTQVLYRHGLTVTQYLTLSICSFVNQLHVTMINLLQHYIWISFG